CGGPPEIASPAAVSSAEPGSCSSARRRRERTVNDPSKTSPNDKIVAFPDAEEKARRLRIEVERLAKLPVVECMLYVPDSAQQRRSEVAKLQQMAEAVIRTNERAAREARGELHRAEKQRRESEHKQEREEERKEREARKEEERRERETRKEQE